MLVKAVTFDLWLTLIWDEADLEEYRKLRRLVNFHRFAKKFAKNSSGNSQKSFRFNDVRLALEQVQVKVKARYEQGFDVHPLERGKMLFDLLKIKIPRSEAETVYEKAGSILSNSGYYKKYPNVNPEAKPTLKALKETYPKVKVALISNAARSSKTYLRMLRSFGLDGFFDELIISCEVGYLKPRREIFDTALRSLSVRPKEALHVGDLFRADIVGAVSIGMNAALYTGLWQKYAQYMNPGEHVPSGFAPNGVLVTEIERLQETVELIEQIG